MLETLTHTTFTPHLGTLFGLQATAAISVEMELTTVTPWQARTATGDDAQRPRTPFSLVFRGPRAPLVPQGTYPLAHAHLGTFELFLVPLGPDQQGMRYEAIFT